MSYLVILWQRLVLLCTMRAFLHKDNDVEKDKDKLPADTADLEGIVDDLQSTANRSPRTERLFRGMEQALFDKWLFDVSDQEAVAMQPGLLKFPDTQNT